MLLPFLRAEKGHPTVDQPRRRRDGREPQFAAGALEAAPYATLLVNHLAVPVLENQVAALERHPHAGGPVDCNDDFQAVDIIVEDPIPGQPRKGIELDLCAVPHRQAVAPAVPVQVEGAHHPLGTAAEEDLRLRMLGSPPPPGSHRAGDEFELLAFQGATDGLAGGVDPQRTCLPVVHDEGVLVEDALVPEGERPAL